VIVVAMGLAVPGAVPARAADARLEQAQQRRAAVEERLAEVQGRLDALQSEVARVEDRVAQLQQSAKAHQATARQADAVLHARVVDAYKRGEVPVAMSLLGDGAMEDLTERARLLTVLALRDHARSESAVSAQIRARATAADVATALDDLDSRRGELDAARREVAAALDAARSHEEEVERTLATEVAARERAARQRAARQGGSTVSVASSGGGAAPVSGGSACPVGSPRSYSDTYGAPRSGGRSHMGTDIMAPHGTPSYAYESGTISRMNSSSLGGISLYMTGDSGTVYYYTHLSGYAAGASAGKRVSAGELIA
jgi:murein DD-endopeptidase MepM/ murein hydrolase activator NlpD